MVVTFVEVFEVVPHKTLLEKLKFDGIGDNIQAWNSSFIIGHEQCVVVDVESSINIQVETGAPHRTVLKSPKQLAHALSIHW